MSTPATRRKSTAARCGAEPLPEEAKLSLPGAFFAASTNSRRVVMPVAGLQPTTIGELDTWVIGRRSVFAL